MSDIKKQLKKLDISKLHMNNGNTVKNELRKHARILADCLMEELDKAYSSYSPSVYQRTYDLYNSVSIDDVVKVEVGSKGSAISMRVYFDDGAIHSGLFGDSANVAELINNGWTVKKDVWFKDIYHFGHYEGAHFIEKAISKYKSKVSNPFEIQVNFYS